MPNSWRRILLRFVRAVWVAAAADTAANCGEARERSSTGWERGSKLDEYTQHDDEG